MQPSPRKKKTGSASLTESKGDLVLSAILDMRQMRDLKRQLLELRSKGRPCVIDAHHVVRVSTGSLQLLAAFVTTMTDARTPVTLRKPAGVLIDGFKLLGLSELSSKFRTEY